MCCTCAARCCHSPTAGTPACPTAAACSDLAWLRSDGEALDGDQWRDPNNHVLGCLIGQPGRAAAPLLLLVNGDAQERAFRLPAGWLWQLLLDSTEPDGRGRWQCPGAGALALPAHSLWLLAASGAVPRTA